LLSWSHSPSGRTPLAPGGSFAPAPPGKARGWHDGLRGKFRGRAGGQGDAASLIKGIKRQFLDACVKGKIGVMKPSHVVLCTLVA
jgi:hypothetical protein